MVSRPIASAPTWRFRDYVIAAFNHDLPYDQFVREQIAGDALGVPIATGFIVGGPVDIVGSPDPVLTANGRTNWMTWSIPRARPSSD